VTALIERIGALRRKRGLMVLLVEQNLEFIRDLADRVLLIHRGRIVRELPRQAIEDPSLEQEFIGVSPIPPVPPNPGAQR
jgi:ABC-type branched-subunit amino acid transport system ATPase component